MTKRKLKLLSLVKNEKNVVAKNNVNQRVHTLADFAILFSNFWRIGAGNKNRKRHSAAKKIRKNIRPPKTIKNVTQHLHNGQGVKQSRHQHRFAGRGGKMWNYWSPRGGSARGPKLCSGLFIQPGGWGAVSPSLGEMCLFFILNRLKWLFSSPFFHQIDKCRYKSSYEFKKSYICRKTPRDRDPRWPKDRKWTVSDRCHHILRKLSIVL